VALAKVIAPGRFPQVSVSCGFEPCVALGLNLVKYNLPGGPISGVHYRVEPMDDGQNFLVPTHELFHDPDQEQRITRDSIVVRR
jgi:hypothetical protein